MPTIIRLGVIIVTCSTIGVALSTGPVMACTCAAPAAAVAGLERSVAVFRGKVAGIHRPFWHRLGITKSDSYVVSFEVVKQWKGSPARKIDVVTRLTGEACGFPFEENQEYLVYVVREPKDLQTGICTGTKSVNDAGEEMRQLDELVTDVQR